MNKILLIIKREYLTRVMKKSFLMVTFLVPVLFIGMMSLVVYLAVNQGGLGDVKKVQVVDESGWFANKIQSSKTIQYSFATDYTATKKTFIKNGYDYLLYVPASMKKIQLFGESTPSVINSGKIEDELTRVARSRRLSEAHIDSAVLASTQAALTVEPKQISETGETDANVMAKYGIGLACAFLIYMSLFLYGAQVMRGVIEEKVSRIIEVMISSVKPFQLMLGKIIGVGMVGLTQFILWIVLTAVLSAVAGSAVGPKMAAMQQVQTAQQAPGVNAAMSGNAEKMEPNKIAAVITSFQSLPIAQIVLCFLFYFMFGYLLYSALFAAVGSAVDNETETQQFMLPVTMPLIFTIILSQSVIVNNPDSALSIWLSMIPFTSPIAMMIRIPFGVPPLQIAASMVLMVLGFLFTTWVAARIYRVGILMYGKKASYKELAKWFMYKE